MNEPPQIAPDILRTGAILLALLSTGLLLVVAALTWGFESGRVIAGVALFVGSACTFAATLAAMVQLFRTPRSTGTRCLFAWCGLLLLGFAAVLMH